MHINIWRHSCLDHVKEVNNNGNANIVITLENRKDVEPVVYHTLVLFWLGHSTILEVLGSYLYKQTSPLCHGCGFDYQQRVVKTFLGSGYLAPRMGLKSYSCKIFDFFKFNNLWMNIMCSHWPPSFLMCRFKQWQSTRKNIFTCLFSVHNIISLSRLHLTSACIFCHCKQLFYTYCIYILDRKLPFWRHNKKPLGGAWLCYAVWRMFTNTLFYKLETTDMVDAKSDVKFFYRCGNSL